MRLPLPSDFFAPVRLSAAEINDLQCVEARLLSTYLARYDAHANETQPSAWKFVGRRAGVKIFSQQPKKKTKKQRSSDELEVESESATDTRRSCQDVEDCELPALRLVGSVNGTLEDVLYGSMWTSGRERAARSHFTGDGVADAAVLCSVDTPSSTDPFRSLSVKWALKRAPHGGLVVKDRDFCYLAAVGIVHSPRSGVKLGYRLRHSITFPSCPPFQNHSVLRGQIFLCSFFRQLRNGRVEVFHEGTYDVGGGSGTIGLGLPKSIAEKSIVQTLLSLENIQACALAKKLARAVEYAEAERAVASLSSTSVQESLDGERRCGMCLHRLGSALKRRCAACRHWTCSQCSVRQEIAPPTRAAWINGPISARCFCKACVGNVLCGDAALYASRDATRDNYEVTSGRWGHDDISEENKSGVPNRRYQVEVFSGKTHLSEAEDWSYQRWKMMPTAITNRVQGGSSVSSLSAKQLSVYSEAMNTVNSSPTSRRRSSTLSAVPAMTTRGQHLSRSWSRRRVSTNAPDILLRSDVGKRNWASSTSALQSPQRHVDDSLLTNIHRNHHNRRSERTLPSARQVNFGNSCCSRRNSDEVRVRMVTRQSAASYSAPTEVISRKVLPGPGSPSIGMAHKQLFRELYGN